jgi:hypothetical protein
MNQPTEPLSTVITFRNSIVDVNQYRQTKKLSSLLDKLLTSLAPNGQNLTCFPLITILQHKNIYHESMKGDWATHSEQIDVYYKDYYALTNFIPTKPSPEVSLAIGKLTQFASDMNYENLIISIRPIILQQPINLEFKNQVITEKAQLNKLKAELAQSEAELDTRLEKGKLEFHALKESIFPVNVSRISVPELLSAPEPQPLSHESDAAWRRTPIAQTPAQILAPQNPVIKTVRSFRTRPVNTRHQMGQLERIAKLCNTPETSPHHSLSNQP